MAHIVLSVGQCGFDDSRLARLLRDELGAPMDRAHSAAEAQRLIAEKRYDLILVNRIFDGDGSPGVDFIADLKERIGAPEVAPPIMLISDYPDAQAAAIANGAEPGFGKSQLSDPALGDRLRTLVKPTLNQ